MTFKALAICGSFHPGSANQAALDVARRILGGRFNVDLRASSAVDRLPALDPALFAALPEEVAAFRREVDGAQAVIVAGPEYGGGVAGSLKNALDWCVGSGGLYRKVAAVMSAGTSGGKYAIEQLARTLLWQGAHVVAHVGISNPKAKSDAAGRLVDPVAVEAIGEACAALVEAMALGEDERAVRAWDVGRGLGIVDYPHRPG